MGCFECVTAGRCSLGGSRRAMRLYPAPTATPLIATATSQIGATDAGR
jgi:hypothetical protein